MAGVYIHIPFCRQACTYCNFHFSTSLRYKEEMIQSLRKELELEKEYLGSEEVETVYIGGGSPSLLTMKDCQVLLEAVHRNYKIVSGPEITLEANPDDISAEKLQAWKSLGINRLSIGIQSFFGRRTEMDEPRPYGQPGAGKFTTGFGDLPKHYH